MKIERMRKSVVDVTTLDNHNLGNKWTHTILSFSQRKQTIIYISIYSKHNVGQSKRFVGITFNRVYEHEQPAIHQNQMKCDPTPYHTLASSRPLIHMAHQPLCATRVTQSLIHIYKKFMLLYCFIYFYEKTTSALV